MWWASAYGRFWPTVSAGSKWRHFHAYGLCVPMLVRSAIFLILMNYKWSRDFCTMFFVKCATHLDSYRLIIVYKVTTYCCTSIFTMHRNWTKHQPSSRNSNVNSIPLLLTYNYTIAPQLSFNWKYYHMYKDKIMAWFCYLNV